jgi:hypothetical protein
MNLLIIFSPSFTIYGSFKIYPSTSAGDSNLPIDFLGPKRKVIARYAANHTAAKFF